MINQTLAAFFATLPNWLVILIIVWFCLVAVTIGVTLTWMVARKILSVRWKDQTTRRRIFFTNNGNVRGVFELQAESQDKNLTFRYQVDGLELTPAPLEAPAELVTTRKKKAVAAGGPAGAQAPGVTQGGQGASLPQVDVSKLEADKKKAKEAAEKAKGKAQGILGIGRILTSIVGTVGSLLPGAAGAAAKEQAAAMQSTTQMAGAAVAAPEIKITQAQSLQKQVNSLKPKDKQAPAIPAAMAGSIQQQAAQSAAPGAQPVYAAEAALPVAEVEEPALPAHPAPGFVETPAVKPGELLAVDLVIHPVHQYRTGDFPVILRTRQVDQVDVPSDQELEISQRAISVPVKGVSVWYRILSIFVILSTLAANGLWIFFWIRWLVDFIV